MLEFPVVSAVERGHEEVALFLLSVTEGNAAELVDQLDRPLLLRAARRGMAGMVRALAALGCDVAEDDHRKGHTALCMAARSGSVETIRAVVELYAVSGRCLAGFVHGRIEGGDVIRLRGTVDGRRACDKSSLDGPMQDPR